jgi:voltage-gated sodium channel
MTSRIDRAQAWFLRIQSNKLFEVFVITVILVSAVLVGVRTYPVGQTYLPVLNTLDYLVTLFFLAEILIRMAGARGLRAFFSKGWNVFDFVVVAVSLVPLSWAGTVLVARLLRVFRVLRLVSFIPELRVLVNALVKSLPRLFYVAVMMFVIFYIYGAVGSLLFGRINETLWGDIGVAMLTLFRIATFEDWTDVMYETMTVYPVSWLYYVTFIFLAAFVFLNMVIGIILDVMQREHERYDREVAAGEAEAGAQAEAPPAADSHQLAEVSARLERIERLLGERLPESGR